MKLSRVLIAGTSSGSGKTTAVSTLLALLLRRSIEVFAYKCGPDYIDPMFHRAVSGVPCANLDPFFCDEDLLRAHLCRASGARLALIEGVMGYYDGAGENGTAYSTFTVAKATRSPVILTVDAGGAAASLLATIEGFLRFVPESRIDGVLFNRAAKGQYAMLKRWVNEHFGGKVIPVGYIPRLPEDCRIPQRHLGLVTAADFGLPLKPDAPVILAPNVGSYVGGDITAGALTSMIWNTDETTLFIDLGTNGELVFGNNEFLMSCACSAGPAFEGGDISCGMRATDGAIEAVVIDKGSMEPSFEIVGKSGQKPVGLCGSGLIDIIAELYRTEIIDSKGKFVREGRRVARDEHGMGRYILAFKDESETGREICITEVDIESFTRAKAAIYSAIDTMLTSLDMTPDVLEDIYVAGGIGSGINIKNAIRIGMLPDIEVEKYKYIGNSSLAGAYAMVLSDAACRKVHEIASNMTYLELSTYPGYMDYFVAACFIPHTDLSLFPTASEH